jgi:hypothetical protein
MRDAALGKVSSALDEQRRRIQADLKATQNAGRLAADDSARGVANRDLKVFADSLKKMKGSDILKGLFGTPRKPAARDTTRADTAKH